MGVGWGVRDSFVLKELGWGVLLGWVGLGVSGFVGTFFLKGWVLRRVVMSRLWFRREDALCGFYFLGFGSGECVEVNALHPLYRRGERGWNCRKGAWPVVGYVRSGGEYLGFVERYAGSRLVLVGLDPRFGPVWRGGYLVSSGAGNVRCSRTCLVDIDVQEGDGGGLASFVSRRVDPWFLDHGFVRPRRSSSGGGGLHLLVAYPEVVVSAVPDVVGKKRAFRDVLLREFGEELLRLGCRLDPSTYDLARRVKAFGTRKLGGACSTFRGRRVEDVVFREYLLGLEVVERVSSLEIPLGESLPGWFEELLRADRRTRLLYEGRGKRAGDLSPSGFDFSLLRHLLVKGYTDVKDLQTVIWLRPGSNARQKPDGAGYVRRSVLRALSL